MAFAQAFAVPVEEVEEHWHGLAPPYESLFNGEKVFTVASPSLGRDGTFMGVVGVDINLTADKI